MFGFFQAPGTPPLSDQPGWVQSLVGAVGGWGLLVIAFVDSSFGTLPILNDLLVIWLSIQNPSKMVFYASMATLGSLLGCLTLYFVARKGGEAVLYRQKKATPERIERIRRWYERNEFLTIAIPSVMPPPTPFKVFIVAAGVFQVRLKYFLGALAVGRGLRYFAWGFLAVWKGAEAVEFIRNNFVQMSAGAIGVILVIYVAIRVWQRYRARRRPAAT